MGRHVKGAAAPCSPFLDRKTAQFCIRFLFICFLLAASSVNQLQLSGWEKPVAENCWSVMICRCGEAQFIQPKKCFTLTSTFRSQGGYKNDAELQVVFANIHAVTCRCHISKCIFCKCIFSNHSCSRRRVWKEEEEDTVSDMAQMWMFLCT